MDTVTWSNALCVAFACSAAIPGALLCKHCARPVAGLAVPGFDGVVPAGRHSRRAADVGALPGNHVHSFWFTRHLQAGYKAETCPLGRSEGLPTQQG